MATITFDPPGHLDDLDDVLKRAWHDYLSGEFDDARQGSQGDPFDAERRQFFNPAKVSIDADAVTADVEWSAFPRQVEIAAPSKMIAWQRADADRGRQDEYCEWSLDREETTGAILRATFTCEDREYWRIFAEGDPDDALAVYREHVNPDVQMNDLFDAQGGYQQVNRWNQDTRRGAMHMIQGANNISAAIILAAGASVVRARADGTILTDTRALIQCGAYGAVERNSDPFIGAGVNAQAQRKADVTLANPVGLAFASLDTQGFETPDGSPAADWWRYTRGSDEMPQRLVVEAPAGSGRFVSDLKIDDQPVRFGGQIAEKITMRIRALATRIGQSTVEPLRGCVGGGPISGLAAMSGMAMPRLRGRI